MVKNINWTVVFAMLATSCFLGGIAFKPIFEYSPTFGSLLGFISLLIAIFFAMNRYRNPTK